MHLLIDHQQGAAAEKRTVARILAWAEARGWSGLRIVEPRGAGEQMDRVMSIKGIPAADTDVAREELGDLEGVVAVSIENEPLFKVVDSSQTQSQVTLEDGKFGEGYTSLIAGPCSVEDQESLLKLAIELKDCGATALRAGAYKPRTSPYSFPGQGPAGLEILTEVSRQVDLPIVTEVLDPADVALVAEHAAMLQIGSRNMSNGALLREAGAANRPVLLKRGMSATISEFLQAAEYLADAGCSQIVLCERGLRHFDHELRNLLDLSAVPLLKQRTHMPVVVDPSHGTGRADLVPTMMVAAAAAGADGLLVEVHANPPQSVSDAHQTISVPSFRTAAETVSAVLQATGRQMAACRNQTSLAHS